MPELRFFLAQRQANVRRSPAAIVMETPVNRKAHRRLGRSTKFSGEPEQNALVRPLHRKALLKLQGAGAIEQYWMAAQALTEASAPCSTRWFCVRPIRMVSALMLLRETAELRGQVRSQREEEDAVQLKDLFARHPAMLHFRRNGRASMLHLNGDSAAAQSKTAQDWLHRRRWKYGVALAFWERKRIEGFLLLHRSTNEGDFSSAELASLRELHPHLQTALCRLIATRKHQAHKSSVASILRPLPLPVVLCDSDQKIVCESAAGLAARTNWELGEGRAKAENHSSRRPLPSDLSLFCQTRIYAWEKAKPRQRARLEKEECAFEHASAAHLRATVRMIRPTGFPLVGPQLLIQFESGAASPGGQALKGKFEALSGVSARERELALLVCEGHGNARIAQELGKSLHTVKAQLGSIFAKLGVKSRGQLVARLTRASMFLLSFFSSEDVRDFFGAEDLIAYLF